MNILSLVSCLSGRRSYGMFVPIIISPSVSSLNCLTNLHGLHSHPFNILGHQGSFTSHLRNMSSILRILSSRTLHLFQAMWYPLDIIIGSIFKALRGRTQHASDSEATSSPTSAIVSYKGHLLTSLIPNGTRMSGMNIQILCPTLKSSKCPDITPQGFQRLSVAVASVSSEPLMSLPS